MPKSNKVMAKKVMVQSSSRSTSGVQSALSPRIVELQQKIQDDSYIDYAIDRIAVVMSRHIAESRGSTGNGVDFMIQ